MKFECRSEWPRNKYQGVLRATRRTYAIFLEDDSASREAQGVVPAAKELAGSRPQPVALGRKNRLESLLGGRKVAKKKAVKKVAKKAVKKVAKKKVAKKKKAAKK